MTVVEALGALFTALLSAFTEWWATKSDTAEKTKTKTLAKWAAMFAIVLGGLWYTGYISRKNLPDLPPAYASTNDVASIKAELAEIKALLAKKR